MCQPGVPPEALTKAFNMIWDQCGDLCAYPSSLDTPAPICDQEPILAAIVFRLRISGLLARWEYCPTRLILRPDQHPRSLQAVYVASDGKRHVACIMLYCSRYFVVLLEYLICS